MELISKDDALMCLTGEFPVEQNVEPLKTAIKRIKEFPGFKITPPSAKWLKWDDDYGETATCSKCRKVFSTFGEDTIQNTYRYCPGCGAIMTEAVPFGSHHNNA